MGRDVRFPKPKKIEKHLFLVWLIFIQMLEMIGSLPFLTKLFGELDVTRNIIIGNSGACMLD